MFIKELKDKEWLKTKYVDEKLSARSIGEIVGCKEFTVYKALKLHGVKIRTNSESHKLLTILSKYKLLNDSDWLYKKYIEEKKSINEIAKLVGAKTSNSVRQALIKFKIPVRSIGEGLICNRKDEGFVLNNISQQVIEGSLLGDAFLIAWNNGIKNGNATLCKKNKFYDHVLFFGEKIFGSIEKAKERIKEDSSILTYKGIKKQFTCFSIRTYSHKELTDIYKRWYPASNNFTKLVPLDFELTKTSLLHWFMDDGCSHRRVREYKNTRKATINRQNHNQIIIVFASESFTKEDQQRLANQMNDKFGLAARVRPYIGKNNGTGWRIFIPQAQAQKFFEIIGPCPVPSLAYKWK